MGCSQPSVEFTFDTKKEYEEELQKMIRSGESSSPKGVKKYDALLDEYLKFCDTDDEEDA